MLNVWLSFTFSISHGVKYRIRPATFNLSFVSRVRVVPESPKRKVSISPANPATPQKKQPFSFPLSHKKATFLLDFQNHFLHSSFCPLPSDVILFLPPSGSRYGPSAEESVWALLCIRVFGKGAKVERALTCTRWKFADNKGFQSNTGMSEEIQQSCSPEHESRSIDFKFNAKPRPWWP